MDEYLAEFKQKKNTEEPLEAHLDRHRYKSSSGRPQSVTPDGRRKGGGEQDSLQGPSVRPDLLGNGSHLLPYTSLLYKTAN